MKRVYDGNALWVGRLAKSIMSVGLIAGLSLASWTAIAETITAGKEHTCMIKPDQSVICWGDNTYLQATPPDHKFVEIDAGYYHNCGLTTEGTIACWGRDSVSQASPPAGNNFIQVSAGDYHSCGVNADGTLFCWGNDTHGKTVVPEGKFVQVSAGDYHTCAVKTDKTVACWGHNRYGQTISPQDETFTYVGAGSFFSCGIKTDGGTVCWGYDGAHVTSDAPLGISIELSLGSHYNACRVREGGVNCWGSLTAPQGQFSHVGAGHTHACGIKTNGKVLCWGWGDDKYGKKIPPAELADIEELYGCTNPNALNYNSNATVDEGKCRFTETETSNKPIAGCTNPNAINYHPHATIDDGHCQFSETKPEEEPLIIAGCLDPKAINYHPDASKDDGNCQYVTTCEDIAVYDLDKRTLTLPFIQIPAIDLITKQATGKVETWSATLKHQHGNENRFRLLNKTLTQIIDDTTSQCPAKYYLENGKLFIPYVSVPTGLPVGDKTQEIETELYRVTLIWMQIGRHFIIQDLRKR